MYTKSTLSHTDAVAAVELFDQGFTARSVALSLDFARAPVQMLYERWQLRGSGALVTRDRRQYDFETKLEIVRRHVKGESGRALSAEYELPSPSTVANWTSIYRRDGEDGLRPKRRGRPPEMLAYLGVDEGFVPPLVAAVSGGTIPGSQYQVSMGTAEVILRVLEEPPSREARERLAKYLINCVRHVVDGQFVLVAGVKTGLLMRRSLQLFGIEDAQVCALPPGGYLPEGSVVVRGARNDDGVLSLTIPADGVTPAEAFRAILLHGNDEIKILLEAMNREVPPATSTLLSGDWGAMECVRNARTQGPSQLASFDSFPGHGLWRCNGGERARGGSHSRIALTKFGMTPQPDRTT